MPKTSKCNRPNARCLNNKEQQKDFLRDIEKIWKNMVIDKERYYSYHIMHNGKEEEHHFYLKKIKDKNKSKLTLILYDKDKKEYGNCLDMTFETTKKVKQRYVGFRISKINFLENSICGLNSNNKITEKVSGTFVLKLANKLNDIFEVEISKLYDYSKIKVCDNMITLPIFYIYKYGKTWYHKIGDFVPDNAELYITYEKCKGLTIKKLVDYLTGPIKEIGDFRLRKKHLDTIHKILDKMGKTTKITIKNAIVDAFNKKSILSDCEKYDLFKIFFVYLPDRKSTIDDEEINNFYKFKRITDGQILSTRIRKF